MKNTPKINVFFEQNNNKEENFQNLDPNLTLESWTALKKNVHNALINAPKLTNLFIRKWCLYKSEGVYYTYLTKKALPVNALHISQPLLVCFQQGTVVLQQLVVLVQPLSLFHDNVVQQSHVLNDPCLVSDAPTSLLRTVEQKKEKIRLFYSRK